MKINFKYIVIIMIVVSCQSNQVLFDLYVHDPKTDGSEIFGNPKNSFFGTRDSNDIMLIKIPTTERYRTELKLIKNKLVKSEYSYNPNTFESLNGEEDILDGYYKYSFVLDNDTIYSGVSMNTWLYINKEGLLKTIFYKTKYIQTLLETIELEKNKAPMHESEHSTELK